MAPPSAKPGLVVGATIAAAAAATLLLVYKRKRSRESEPSPLSASATVVSLDAFLKDPASEESKAACAAVAKSLLDTGIVILRDPRVSESKNNASASSAFSFPKDSA